MNRKLLRAAGVLAVMTSTVVVLAPAGAAAPKKPVKKTVGVLDYSYDPARLTLPAGSIVTWVWPVDGNDSHDVVLGKGPKGVKKFASEVATAEYIYKYRFKVAGKYHIICTLHDEMTMDITVR